MKPTDPSRFLRWSLRANALFSLLSGAGFALAQTRVALFLGDVAPLLMGTIGLQLIVFGAALLWLSTRPAIPVPLALAVIGADVLWVLGTALVVYADVFSREGAWAALVVANLVALFAVLQSIGVHKLRAGRSPRRNATQTPEAPRSAKLP